LTDLLAEGRSGDDLRRFRPREARAAVARGERQHGVVPAGEIFLGLAPAGMVVRLVLVVEERLDPGSILRPGRRDPALVVIGRGIGLARRGQHDPAIELQLVEAFAAQGAVLVMHPEKHDPALGVPKRPHRRVRDVVTVAGILRRREHDLARPDERQRDERRLGGDGLPAHDRGEGKHDRRCKNPHFPMPELGRTYLAIIARIG
jgi:hypothetical protein